MLTSSMKEDQTTEGEDVDLRKIDRGAPEETHQAEFLLKWTARDRQRPCGPPSTFFSVTT
jgi:hypothetical protein